MDIPCTGGYPLDMRRLPGLNVHSRLLLALIVLAILGALAAAFWLLFNVVRPAPPRTVHMLTGAPGGAYVLFAERYREALAREGIELVLHPSSGSVENLRQLKMTDDFDLALLQSGVLHEPESKDLVLLGNMYVEPVWIFHRLPGALDRLTQLDGARIAVGAPESGTQLLALQLLAATGMAIHHDKLLPLGARAAAAALLEGNIDAAFIVGAPEAPAVAQLLRAPGIRLLDLAHAEAYARRLPHLAPLLLPSGAIDLAAPQPEQDVRLLGATANLVARADLHPAIVTLILQAAKGIHGRPGLFEQASEYPRLRGGELPPHPAASRFFESGPPFLQRYLPFWLAVLADRLLVSLLPVIALLIPLMRVAPLLYAWRMRSRIYRWYGELKFLEHDVEEHRDVPIEEALARLDRIEEQANRRRVPLAFANELYTLREHVQLVRRKLLRHARSAGSEERGLSGEDASAR